MLQDYWGDEGGRKRKRRGRRSSAAPTARRRRRRRAKAEEEDEDGGGKGAVEESHDCEDCGKSYRYLGSLKKHMLSEHGKDLTDKDGRKLEANSRCGYFTLCYF